MATVTSYERKAYKLRAPSYKLRAAGEIGFLLGFLLGVLFGF